jgi:hypothetical protein
MSLLLRLLRWMPKAINKVHLEWALREIDPLHPDVSYIVNRLRELEEA